MSAAVDGVGVFTDWLGTFALHSTLALGFACVASWLLQGRALVLQERLLRLALWVPFVSSIAQQFGMGGRWAWGLSWSDPTMPLATDLSNRAIELAGQWSGPSPVAAPAPAPVEVPWSWLLLGMAAAFAILGVQWLWRSHARLQRVLVAREPETDARVLTIAAKVAGSLGMCRTPHLSRSPALATPIAFGWLRPEICLPARAATLGDGSLRAMLAHELAHLRRCDPAWMWFAAVLQAVMPWQPLLWLARRRWVRLVELRCDAVAARESSPAAVARCLLDVADWLRPNTPAQTFALGMAAKPSALRERVEAALAARDEGRPTRLGALVFAAGALAAMTFAAPGLARAGEELVFDVEDVFVPEAPAPATLSSSTSSAASSPAAMLALLDAEYLDLVKASQRAVRDLDPADPMSAALASKLGERLANLERMRTRLHDAVARRTLSLPSR
ncbi:MAG: M56 family metallopeptidase [Planctomycetes bacterium]|nr:M56 family metallopeptidase [Planctomycetota bacterium]